MLNPEDVMSVSQALATGILFLSVVIAMLIISNKRYSDNGKKQQEVEQKVKENKLERFEYEDDTHYNVRRYNEIVRKQREALAKECATPEEKAHMQQYSEALNEQEQRIKQQMKYL